MKNSLLILIVCAAMFACKSGDQKTTAETATGTEKVAAQAGDTTSLQWLDSIPLNLGEVNEGEIVEVVFNFRNTGNKPLVISDVRPGCGCTDAVKPEGAIAAGEEGKIKAKFNSKGYKGRMASKNISVTANTKPGYYDLGFNVNVR